jgi:glyoxylase-like metal-dependent hydrolase (beta-lactamase superfamily II)
MTIHFLNCFTSGSRVPANWLSGTLCLLIETKQGWVLVDTGPGERDYVDKPGIIRAFQVMTVVPLLLEETVVRQVARLGIAPENVRHIVLTHMHFDHCGGLPDFPWAKVHVHRKEYEAFTDRRRHWTELAYVRRHLAHQPDVALYEHTGERWYDFDAVRLPFDPEMWLVPLFGHSRGLCGVAIRTDNGWLFHVGDAGPMDLSEEPPSWLVRLVLGPHTPRLREFRAAHPEVRIVTGHMWLDFFEKLETTG